MLRVEDLEKDLPKIKHGFSIRFAPKRINKLIENPNIDYSCWKNEEIGIYDFA